MIMSFIYIVERKTKTKTKIFSRNLTKVSEPKKNFVGEVLGRH